MKSFEDIGNMDIDDAAKPPPTLPKGSYLVGITGIPEVVTANTGTKGWSFHIKFFQPRDDVDRDELQTVLSEREMSLTDFEMDDRFYVTDASKHILAGFLRDVMGVRGNVNQAVAECTGKQYIATLSHVPFTRQDGTMGLQVRITGRARAS